MTSQAGAASSPPSDALRWHPGMRRAAPAHPPAGQRRGEELHGAAGGKTFPGPCRWLLFLACWTKSPTSAHPLPGTGPGLASRWWPWPRVAAGTLSAQDPPRAKPKPSRLSLLLLLFLSLSIFSSTDIAFPGVAITTGVKSLLTLPCCTNCTISCHCYMPVISFEGLKLLSATSSAPLLPPWA